MGFREGGCAARAGSPTTTSGERSSRLWLLRFGVVDAVGSGRVEVEIGCQDCGLRGGEAEAEDEDDAEEMDVGVWLVGGVVGVVLVDRVTGEAEEVRIGRMRRRRWRGESESEDRMRIFRLDVPQRPTAPVL